MTTDVKRFGWLDRAWLTISVIAGGVLSIDLATSVFDATVLLSGILCVGLIAIGRREGYLIGFYNSLAYAILAYGNGLYGEVYLNLFFFVPMGMVGYVMWYRHTRRDMTVEMRQLVWSQRLMVAAVCIVCTIGLGFILDLNPRQNTAFIDATTNVLSIMATFLMMGRFKEQWFLYIVLNMVSIGMWFLRFQAGGDAGDLMVLMWTLFLLNAVYGFWRWHQGSKIARIPCPGVKDKALA
jgi:nicotinamide mononucleotide transporter